MFGIYAAHAAPAAILMFNAGFGHVYAAHLKLQGSTSPARSTGRGRPKRDTQFVARSALIGGKRTTAEVAGKGKVGREAVLY
jgi:hypothetical protein